MTESKPGLSQSAIDRILIVGLFAVSLVGLIAYNAMKWEHEEKMARIARGEYHIDLQHAEAIIAIIITVTLCLWLILRKVKIEGPILAFESGDETVKQLQDDGFGDAVTAAREKIAQRKKAEKEKKTEAE